MIEGQKGLEFDLQLSRHEPLIIKCLMSPETAEINIKYQTQNRNIICCQAPVGYLSSWLVALVVCGL